MDRENVAILFTDIRGFTPYTLEKGDEEAFRLAETFVGLVALAVSRHQGQVVKTYGDGVMAYFRGAESAASSAVAMQKALSEHNESHPNERISAGIGIAWGNPIRTEADLFGRSVNEAKRLADYAKGGQILVSATEKGLLEHLEGLHFLDLGCRELKGLGPARLFELVWREELARLSDRDDQITLIVTGDARLALESKKDLPEEIDLARQRLHEVAGQAKGLPRLVLRGVEREAETSLAELVGEHTCDSGTCSERPIDEVDAVLDGDELVLTFHGRRALRLSREDFDVAQMREFFDRLKTAKTSIG